MAKACLQEIFWPYKLPPSLVVRRFSCLVTPNIVKEFTIRHTVAIFFADPVANHCRSGAAGAINGGRFQEEFVANLASAVMGGFVSWTLCEDRGCGDSD